MNASQPPAELKCVLDADWMQLSSLIAETSGLHFPRDRWPDLLRGVQSLSARAGVEPETYVLNLLTPPRDPAGIYSLVHELTIGETYFMRDKAMFDSLTLNVLPELVRNRRHSTGRLRMWSAACCTGEEAYSLAILISRALPDIAEWDVQILATDINPQFLQSASRGCYDDWSFRETPDMLRAQYFNLVAPNRYEIIPEIKKLVTIKPLNLLGRSFPFSPGGRGCMDLILCRNALMYFTPAHARTVVGKLSQTLAPDGWLALGMAESSFNAADALRPIRFPGSLLFRSKTGEPVNSLEGTACNPRGEPDIAAPDREAVQEPPIARSKPTEFIPLTKPTKPTRTPAPRRQTPAVLKRRARALANRGKLGAAAALCEIWILRNRLDPQAYHLRAAVLQELGRDAEAAVDLNRAVYLDPDFALAHYGLGHLHDRHNCPKKANRHYANALKIVSTRPVDEKLEGGDGLTAGRLAEIVQNQFSNPKAMG